MLGGGCISWSSKKQTTIALSTTEAEYTALTFALKQLIWIRRLLHDIGINTAKPSRLFTDNIAAMSIAHDTGYHARTKHIRTQYHFTRQVLQNGEAILIHVPTKVNPADILMKVIDKTQHHWLMKKLGMDFKEGSR
jgi:hypothetical protein